MEASDFDDVPTTSSLNYSTDDVSSQVGKKLATRWNAGIGRFTRVAGLCVSLLFVAMTTVVDPPPIRHYSRLDTTI